MKDEKTNIKIAEQQSLTLLNPIVYDRSRDLTRKWKFVWNGLKISAAIRMNLFWIMLENREMTLTQGDSIIVRLKIYQVLNPYAGIYLNHSYEVINFSGYKTCRREWHDT